MRMRMHYDQSEQRRKRAVSHLGFDRRQALGLLAAAAWPAASQTPAAAFRPTRPVRLISPLLAGGATDAIVRPIAQRLGEIWGQTVIVDNKPGGGTVIGTQAVVQASPDGHTFGVAISALTVNPSLRKDLPYDTFKDISFLTQIGSVSGALVAHPSFEPNTVEALIAAAKAAPGSISYASLGVGTAAHITAELVKVRRGINMVHVPYAGSSAAYRDLLPGRIPIGFVVLESALPHVKAGKLKVLALTDDQRNKLHPQWPILAETVPGLGYDSVFGFIGPRGMASALVEAMNADIVRVLREPTIRAHLELQSMDVVASSPAEFRALVMRDVEHWRKAVMEAGASVSG
jgi:tripartite-type tricarboxylate transporter receptor subunit TctC